MKRIVLSITTAMLVTVLSCASLWAQATAQISGTVKDQTGAVLPGVEVKATQTDTGIDRTTITNETGSYVLPNLVTGPYKLEASLPGFRSFVQTGIVLQVNASPVINPVLEVAQVSEQVEVQANAAQAETRSAGVSTVIENQRVLDLPMNGRNVTDLIALSGMAVKTGTGGGHSRTGVNISVAGGQSFGVQYSLDGAPHLNTYDGTGMPLPFPDALQELRVATSSQDASNGMHSGAAVNSVMKSGTNAVHGDLFEFVRNNAFNARDFF
jgi:Carboxypeptidase regulatory-like domain